ncbi:MULTISPECIES: nucleotidyltransferase family protein [Clostridium]|jgi:dTDP-glucose pyrophosphorylase|uniref:nucleotidyltransferase family protein n=1 Tax=Clostridium TaxID=1485 RepID=UPI00115AB229|nr:MULTISPECIES: nucleotidyltransferase family protein [Clostridium]MBS5308805.1 nucleotidyltransferase family protein [Clostridium sp.]MDB1941375.1 nucleotidyltransferase family protein [Clostridium tertium]MDU3349918.1 nucleotidyltransferase family protein [Clostridium sp.]MDU3409124.1 nucleotidyltransferase family protein [Clostridium sp.]MDU3548904.1 nucleotidyltransferase family protein [Clostridium sp.]
MNKNVINLIIDKNSTVRAALKQLDKGSKGFLAVVDKKNKLVGTITDGDIRRWILKNGSLDEDVIKVMNQNPVSLLSGEEHNFQKVMQKYSIKALPIIGESGNIIDILFSEDILVNECKKYSLKEIPVVIMAGGLGTRLYPYTKILPKPLIPIGDTPIIERIIDKFALFGVNKFYLTVNYKKNMIKSYFNELEKDYNIEYIEEDKPLGTGGSLYLLKDRISETFFVSNCDILIDCDYESVYNHHKRSGNKITVVASVKNFTIPYGVFNLNNHGNIEEIREKPEYSFLINTGMYILEPEVLDDIPKDEFYNLPDVLEKYMKTGVKVGVYPISELSWMDMGQISEMKDMINRLSDKEEF